mmetsp:Transcript_37086/g.80717  ORF Transcript_37086/g.80717 Transcript_37086/m.80717 type:complete len:204 (-) Transcript_37086:18-629(-)
MLRTGIDIGHLLANTEREGHNLDTPGPYLFKVIQGSVVSFRQATCSGYADNDSYVSLELTQVDVLAVSISYYTQVVECGMIVGNPFYLHLARADGLARCCAILQHVGGVRFAFSALGTGLAVGQLVDRCCCCVDDGCVDDDDKNEEKMQDTVGESRKDTRQITTGSRRGCSAVRRHDTPRTSLQDEWLSVLVGLADGLCWSLY